MNLKSLAKKSGYLKKPKKTYGQSQNERLQLLVRIDCQFQIYIN